MEITNILYIVLLLCASALCVALIVYLNKITKSVNRLEDEIKDVTNKSKPLILSINNLTEKINSIADDAKQISEDAKDQVGVVKNIISDVKDHADKILELEEKVRRGIEDPVTGMITNLSAFVNGINTFWKTYKEKHHT
ncbi:MAG: DUF948 domain-containing protein [Ignavibacteriaceae bacterium]